MERVEVSSESRISVETVISRLFSENCYVAHLEGSGACILVDPGMEADQIIDLITEKRLHPHAILLTHGHADHIAGVEPLKRCFPDCPIVIGTGDAPKLTDPDLNLSARYGLAFITPPPDRMVQGGGILHYAGMELEVRETPGHSCGHVVFIYRGQSPAVVFGGDVLFREGVGRTDFPDGSTRDLVLSIQQQLFTLPPETIVLPGHGPETTIGHEIEFNPYVGRNSPARRRTAWENES